MKSSKESAASSVLSSHAGTCTGGELRLISMPGYGVDAFLTIQHLEGDWEEQRVEPQAVALESEAAVVP
jgi:hypothetical protein